MQILPVVSKIQFDARLAAQIAGLVTKLAWIELRPGWRQVLMLLDHLDARVEVEGYESLSQEDRRAFVKALPYDRAITWWVDGEKVKL